VHLEAFHTLDKSHMGRQQSELVPVNLGTRRPTAGNIVAGIFKHNSISSRGQRCQDASVETAKFQLQNAMLGLCVWHFSVHMGSGRRESMHTI
jgi:hypothetical protein